MSASPRSTGWRALQALLLLALVAFAVRYLASQWGAVRQDAARLEPRWGLIVLSCVPVLASYALLVDVFRTTLSAWGTRLPFWTAARVWTISNLGKYVPGKIWTFGAMAVLTEQAGGSGGTAAAAAVVNQLVTIASGFAVAALFGTGALDAMAPGLPQGVAPLLAVLALLGLSLLPTLLPRAGALAGRLLKRDFVLPALPAMLVWRTALSSAAAWCLFGLGFHVLAEGVSVQLASVPATVAAFTASYLVGFLAIFAAGGMVVRETALVAALMAVGVPLGAATVLALLSRVWLTVLEIVPALVFLAVRPVAPRPVSG